MAAERCGLLPDPQEQTAKILALFANAHRPPDDAAYYPEHFLWKPRRTIQTAEEMEAARQQRMNNGRNR